MSAAAVPSPPRRLVLSDVLPHSRVTDAVLVLAGVALTAALAQVAIHVPPSPVPVTGQTLAVVLVGGSLGLRRGTASLALYLLLGLVLPIYADGDQGHGVLFGSSGGYLFGFVLAAAITGFLAERGSDRKVLLAFATFVLGQLAVFGVGVPWLKVATDESWGWSVHYGFSIFIVGGLFKAALAALALPAAWRGVRRLDHRA